MTIPLNLIWKKNYEMTIKEKLIGRLALLSLTWMMSLPAFSFNLSFSAEETPAKKNFKNVLNINLGAAVVLGLTFQRFHLPLNYERVINKKTTITIGWHPAFPLNEGSSREALGASLRIRNYGSRRAPYGFWRELGIWGIYQRQGKSEEEKSGFSRTYGNSMGGVLGDFGYKYIISHSNLIIEPFLGVALPLVVFSKERTKILGWSFPWAGFSVGYLF